MVRTLGLLAEQWISSPEKIVEAQMSLANGFIDLWASTFRRLQGEEVKPVASRARATSASAATTGR